MPGVLVFGSLNVDHIVEVAALPAPGQTVLSQRYSVSPGGKGRNQAVAVAAAGGRAWLAGAVGDDGAGRQLREDLAGRGIDHSLVSTVPGQATGLALISVDATGENTIVVHAGANARAAAPAEDQLDPARHRVLLCSLEVPLPAVAATAAAACRRGLTTVVNAAPMVGAGDGRLAAVLDHTDVLVVNRSEALEMAGAAASSDPAGAVAEWRAADGPEVVVTLGGSGAVWVGAGGTSHFPAAAVQARSTVGAGDTFVGVMAVALAGGRALGPAVETAVEAASAFVAGDRSLGRARTLLSAGARPAP